MSFYIVGLTRTCRRLAVTNTEHEAVEYIGRLPYAEEGIYYIDRCREPVTLAIVPADDLAEDRS
jgi:hypothetical protein